MAACGGIMAKCIICKSRKGKRKCRKEDAFICSQCCGETRSVDKCGDCSHFRQDDPQRKYLGIPRYSLQEMGSQYGLQDMANSIEGTFCAYELKTPGGMSDPTAIKTLELLLDKHYFKDDPLNFPDQYDKEIFAMVQNTIETDLKDEPHDKVTKILATILFVAKRRSRGGREYLNFIQGYVGVRTDDGGILRVIPR